MTQSKINKLNTNQTTRLSVQVSLNGLSFFGKTQTGELSYFAEKTFPTSLSPDELLGELQSELQGSTISPETIEEITVVYATPYATVVPTSLYDVEKASEYLKFNTKILSNDFVTHDTLDNQQLTIVYVPFMNINNYLFDRFGDFKFFHQKGVLLDYFLNKEKHVLEPKIFLHFTEGQFECIIIKKGKLLLCNTYTYRTPEDLAYYTLFCFEQLSLNPNKDETIISGSISRESDDFQILYNYIRNIDFLELESPLVQDEAPHRHLVHKLLS